jgi:hypothetical protein
MTNNIPTTHFSYNMQQGPMFMTFKPCSCPRTINHSSLVFAKGYPNVTKARG